MGFGAVQELDSAAMSLFIKYRQHDGELTGGPFDGGLDAFRYVSTGGIINFWSSWLDAVAWTFGAARTWRINAEAVGGLSAL